MQLPVQLIAGMIGTIGFALIFHVQYKYLPLVASGGFLCWLVYVLGTRFIGSDAIFLPTLISGFTTAMYAEILARICKAPSTVFFLTSVIPLIPGRPLFYCVQAIVMKENDLAVGYGLNTFLTALGIALGMSVAWTLCDFERKIRNLRHSG